MKKTIAIIAALTLSACADTSSTNAPTIVDPLIGKPLVTADGSTTILINGDGTMGGSAPDGSAIVGTYTADANEICSTLTAPERFAGTRCSVPTIEDGTVVFNRRDGSQSPPYMIQG